MKHVRQALIGIERNSMSIKSNCYMFHSDVKCVREQEVMLIFFRAKVSLFGSDEILLNYASILRDERNYTMVSCPKNRAGEDEIVAEREGERNVSEKSGNVGLFHISDGLTERHACYECGISICLSRH